MELQALKAELKGHALALGFDAIGVAPAVCAPVEAQRHLRWLAREYHGDMEYLARNPGARYDARSLLPECRSVVVAALNYYAPDPDWPAVGEPKVSRYAWGEDYHVVLKDKLGELVEWLSQRAPGRVKSCVDTSPLTEKAFAVAAGIGWQGRNSLVLSQGLGSYFFLGLLLTTAELAPDSPVADQCGTCTACLQACPTDALVGPGMLDATKCVSYLTTERKAQVESGEDLHGWLYGCDTCQQVCPFNTEPPASRERRFSPRESSRRIGVDQALALTEEEFAARFAGTVFKRRKLYRLQAQARALSPRRAG